jgi:hypothetical protein
MSIEEIIIEIEQDLQSYKEAGLIDRASLLRWGLLALNRFGQSVMVKHEEFLYVKDGKALLPDNFHSLHYALKCTPFTYETDNEGVLQSSIFWKERTEKNSIWSTCEPCCEEVTEKTIIEKVYIDDKIFNFHYSSPQPLRLAQHIIKSYCSSDCKNVGVQSEYEISINNKTLYTNFPEGTVYLQYYGMELDENGYYLIPETPRGDLAMYIETHLKKRIFENVLANGDDKNVGALLQYYAAQETLHRGAAIRDARYKTLTPQSYAKIARLNRRNIQKFEVLLPSF